MVFLGGRTVRMAACHPPYRDGDGLPALARQQGPGVTPDVGRGEGALTPHEGDGCVCPRTPHVATLHLRPTCKEGREDALSSRVAALVASVALRRSQPGNERYQSEARVFHVKQSSRSLARFRWGAVSPSRR